MWWESELCYSPARPASHMQSTVDSKVLGWLNSGQWSGLHHVNALYAVCLLPRAT